MVQIVILAAVARLVGAVRLMVGRPAVIMSALLLFACSETDAPEQPARLVIGVLPDDSRDQLERGFQPLVAYLNGRLDVTSTLVVPDSYDELVERFVVGDIDLAWFGGLTYVRAAARATPIPLATRRIDRRFTSVYLVTADSSARSIVDLRGGTFAFGSQSSTSGHLMPRFFLRRMGVDPETFFGRVLYSGSHDETAYRVRDGEADLGVANALIIRSMFADQRLNRQDVRILHETPPYTDYLWAVPASMPLSLRRRILDALLALDPLDPVDARILGPLSADGYVPVDATDMATVIAAARLLDLVGEAGE